MLIKSSMIPPARQARSQLVQSRENRWPLLLWAVQTADPGFDIVGAEGTHTFAEGPGTDSAGQAGLYEDARRDTRTPNGFRAPHVVIGDRGGLDLSPTL